MEQRRQTAAATSARDVYQRQLTQITAERNQVRKEFDAYKAKATLSDEHLSFDAAAQLDRVENWEQALDAYGVFLDHFPHSAMASKAKQRSKAIEEILKQKAAEAAEASELAKRRTPEGRMETIEKLNFYIGVFSVSEDQGEGGVVELDPTFCEPKALKDLLEIKWGDSFFGKRSIEQALSDVGFATVHCENARSGRVIDQPL